MKPSPFRTARRDPLFGSLTVPVSTNGDRDAYAAYDEERLRRKTLPSPPPARPGRHRRATAQAASDGSWPSPSSSNVATMALLAGRCLVRWHRIAPPSQQPRVGQPAATSPGSTLDLAVRIRSFCKQWVRVPS